MGGNAGGRARGADLGPMNSMFCSIRDFPRQILEDGRRLDSSGLDQ